jgi:hypothetical protein
MILSMALKAGMTPNGDGRRTGNVILSPFSSAQIHRFE